MPFKTVFRHASATRRNAENVIVIARDSDGLTGIGEGCPRSYVTGETVASARGFIERHQGAICREIRDRADLEAWIGGNAEEIDANPAAFCALELALVDLLARRAGTGIEAFLGLPDLGGEFRYSAVLGDSPRPLFWLQFRRYWRAGFRDFKVKLGVSAGRDLWKMRLLGRDRGAPVRFRLDANNLWPTAKDCIARLGSAPIGIFAIEEPLTVNALSEFEEVAHALDTRIILDESFLRIDQLDACAANPGRWVLNLRVSKLGGLARSLAVVARARDLGLGVIVGAQVGETSILTRAGLTIAHAAGDALVGMEGAFGTHLLREDLTEPSLMFREGGILRPGDQMDMRCAGNGLNVVWDRLSDFH